MSQVSELQNQITSLQNQLKYQKRQMDTMRKDLTEENRRKLQELRNEMAKSGTDEQVRNQYKRLLSEYQQSMNKDVNNRFLDVNADYQRLVSETQKTEQELAGRTRQLEQLINELRTSVNKKEEGSIEEAHNSLTEAISTFKTIQAKPHEMFTPNRLRVYYNSIMDGQELYKSGLYEAAAAVGISAKTGLERLGFIIDDKIADWERHYEIFLSELEILTDKLKSEVIEWKKLIDTDFKGAELSKDEQLARLVEINFWSGGQYGNIFSETKRFMKNRKIIEQTGKEKYLKENQQAITAEQLEKDTGKINSLEDELDTQCEFYKNSYKAACERFEWGEKLIEFLERDINLVFHDDRSNYRIADSEKLNQQNFRNYIKQQFGDETITEDVREWLELTFENSGGTYIYIYIVPIVKDVKVTNHIILYVDYDGTVQEDYTKDIYSHIAEAVGVQFPEEVIDYVNDISQLRASTNKTIRETADTLVKRSEKRKQQTMSNPINNKTVS